MPLGVHRQMILPTPALKSVESRVELPSLVVASPDPAWLELHRGSDGGIRYYLGAPAEASLSHTFSCLLETHPGAQLGRPTTCPLVGIGSRPTELWRARQAVDSHYWPLRLSREMDFAGPLLRGLASSDLDGHELVLQILFRRVLAWEASFWCVPYSTFLDTVPRELRSTIARRMAETVFHVEVRAAVVGTVPDRAWDPVQGWLCSWLSATGAPWWSLRIVEGRKQSRFWRALADHDIDRCAGKRGRRDLSGRELARFLPIPWRERHPGLEYAGAPAGAPPPHLVGAADDLGQVFVGRSGDSQVRLPDGWHHLAILGKTRSGKSTLALNLVLQILEREPEATVVLLEPTGSLIRSVLERIPTDVAKDTIEIDPAHPTFELEGTEMARVPLNLLHLPDRRGLSRSELERRAERLSGDLLQAVKNAWGEESIGGRADFILRTVLQALLAVDGSNLVDAYSALSDKKALQSLARMAPGDLLRSALRVHLPKLDYSFTISSLDKVGKIATNPLLRKTLCQRYRPIGFDQLLDHRLLLLNLAKGTLGAEASGFLGAILLTRLWSAIQERIRPDLHLPIYLVVDEFHNFAIPAFADMLSEGARLGLHVVAITQYLSRIPEKVRSALVGNVDAWMLFPLGAEDATDAAKIVQAARFGWQPDHLVSGLAPHQVALAVRDALVRVDTLPPPSPRTPGAEPEFPPLFSDTRLAQPEDSEASPLAVTEDQLLRLLQALPELAGLGHEALAETLGLSRPALSAVISRAKAAGDVVENSDEVGISHRGLFHRAALAGARNEGWDHSDLLADLGVYLQDKGIHLRVLAQEGGFLRPDAEFDWRGRMYSVEVESSSLAKHLGQLARNLRKAHASQRRCLVVVGDEASARRVVELEPVSALRNDLWDDVGLLWRSGSTGFELLVPPGTEPWAFLTGRAEAGEEDSPAADSGSSLPNRPDSDLARVAFRAKQLLDQGRRIVRIEDFDGLFGPSDGGTLERQRLGMALFALGVHGRRVRRDGHQERLYDLGPLANPVDPAPSATAGPDRKGPEGSRN